jgi:hypothetical protein
VIKAVVWLEQYQEKPISELVLAVLMRSEAGENLTDLARALPDALSALARAGEEGELLQHALDDLLE